MIKKLLMSGNAASVYLTKPMLQLLGFDPKETMILFTIKNKTLYIVEASEEKIKDIKNPLVKKITKIGDGYGVIIPQSILELMDIDSNKNKVEILIEERTLVIKKACEQ